MNWDQVQGNWKQMKGALKERWGKMTDDDLTMIAGQRDKFVGVVQERYGIAKEEAQRMADEWIATQKPGAEEKPKTFGGGGHA